MIRNCILIFISFFFIFNPLFAKSLNKEKLVFVCKENNDLYQVASTNFGTFKRTESASEAIKNATIGTGLMILADEYPLRQTKLSQQDFDLAIEKDLRIYIEFPEMIPGYETGEIQTTFWERGVIASDAFSPELEEMRIIAIHDCHFIPVKAKNPHIVVARVAGFDNAEYGLEKTDVHPILFKHKKENILISTTKLSGFVTGRYAPKEAWASIWKMIFEWVQPGETLGTFDWNPTVRPSFSNQEKLSNQELDKAIQRGTDWFLNSRMLMDKSWGHMWEEYKNSVGPAPSLELPIGDGKLGVLEGFSSQIDFQGNQAIRWSRRADCTSESGMAIAMQAEISKDDKRKEIAANIQDYIYFNSNLQQKSEQDKENPSHGHIGWDTNSSGIFYGDDNARVILGSLLSSSILQSDKWDEAIIECILGNFRTTGPEGFRQNRLKEKEINEMGWEHFNKLDYTNCAPHYQSWIWACYLWLYNKTGYEPLLATAKKGIQTTMQAYPNEWIWTNGLQQERARMLLPLAWLTRIEDTKEHRAWLMKMADDLISFQDECGAIREELGTVGNGRYGPPASNKAYGTGEAPLIQKNGDPLSDLLYTSNFALFSLTEAAYATDDEKLKGAAKKLAEFFIRIQVQSETHPELDGVWYRAFDYNRWEYWASNADLGWGAWSTESGWTQGWIVTMLGMQKLQTSFWDMTAEKEVSTAFEKIKGEMLPKDIFEK